MTFSYSNLPKYWLREAYLVDEAFLALYIIMRKSFGVQVQHLSRAKTYESIWSLYDPISDENHAIFH